MIQRRRVASSVPRGAWPTRWAGNRLRCTWSRVPIRMRIRSWRPSGVGSAEPAAAPDVRLLEGSPAEALIETADREGAELLVVGSRGRGSLRSAVLGSVSRELAARAPCPVVVVPSGEPAETASRGEDADASVVCGVDGSDQALAAAALAGRLATRLGSRLVLSSVTVAGHAPASPVPVPSRRLTCTTAGVR